MSGGQVSVTPGEARELENILVGALLKINRELERLEKHLYPQKARIATLKRRAALIKPFCDQLKECV